MGYFLIIILKINFLFSIFYVLAYALGFWYGWTLTKKDSSGESEYTVGRIILVFFSIIMGVFSLGNAAPYVSTLAMARAAAYEVYKIIDRVSFVFSLFS